MTPRAFAVALACAGLVSCTGDGDVNGSMRGEAECPNQSRAESSRRLWKEPGLDADVDGDGTEDHVYVAVDPAGDPGCVGFVVAEYGGDTHSVPISHPDLPPGLDFPSLNSTPPINDEPGSEVVVNIAAGASSQFVSVYTSIDGELHEVVVSGDPRVAGSLFGFGASVGHIEGVDCTADGHVAVSAATPQGRRYALERRFLRPKGASWTVDEELTERAVVSLERASRAPEFAGSPFFSCAAA